MRQLMYVSESLIGDDVRALDQLMVQARMNNALEGITGLLWTDGARFAQVVEGGDEAIAALLGKLRDDDRHRELQIVQDSIVGERAFGEWSMTRPANDSLAELYEHRMIRQLSQLTGSLSATFKTIIRGSRPAVA